VFGDWFHSLGLRPLDRIRQDSRETVAWLRSLPPETAVFVPDDHVAGLLIRFLQAHGLDPFDTCAVFSGHHMSATTQIGISGVLQPTRRWAHSAVRLLVDAMEGGGDEGKHVRVPNSGVIERESTVGFGAADPAVAAAQRFILRHLHRDLHVGDVADANPLGRRSLEKKFSRALGHSILDEIQLRKLSAAEHLLLHSGLSLEEVAQSAGFSDLRHFQRVMKKYRGETPGTYRRVRLRQREQEVDDA
jgi:LacI family transcriptional regulator